MTLLLLVGAGAGEQVVIGSGVDVGFVIPAAPDFIIRRAIAVIFLLEVLAEAWQISQSQL